MDYPTLTPDNISEIIREGYQLINAGGDPEEVIKSQTNKLGLLLLNEPEFFEKASDYHLAVARLERSLQ